MTWNYRVMWDGSQYAVHEVFYREDGSIEGWTESAVPLRAESLEELRDELQRYAAALDEPPLDARDTNES